MLRLTAITAMLATLALPALAQNPPADPPVASLPLPDVAVQSLSSAPGRGQTPRASAPAEDPDAPVRFPIVKKRPIVTPVEPSTAGLPSTTRFTPAGELSKGETPSLSSTNATRFIEISPKNKESQKD